MRKFALYPEERHFWSFYDHEHVFSVAERMKPKSVLEFGPGSSTLAFLEACSAHIDTCEDSEDWARVYRARLEARFPDRVTIHAYRWSDPLSVPTVDGRWYDLGFIDGPYGTERRPAVVRYCMLHCDAVLVCCEDAKGEGLRHAIETIADAAGWNCRVEITGPLSGSFALLTP